jgi:O-antigen/teichoic acid export membrane protein
VSFRRDSVFIFASRIIAFLIQASTGLALARLLGPEGRGKYALLLLSPMMLSMALSFGIGTSNVFFISRRRLASARLFANALWLGLLLGLLATVTAFLSAEQIVKHFMRGVKPRELQLISLSVPFVLWFNYLLGMAQGLQRFTLFNLANLLRPLMFLSLFVVLFHGSVEGLTAGLWSYNFAYMVAALTLVVVLRPRPLALFTCDLSALREQMRYGLPAYVAELTTFLFYRVNLVFIGYFLDSEQAGYFAIVILVAESLWFLSNSVGTALLPFAAERSTAQAQGMIPQVVRHVLFLTLCFILVLLVIDRPLIRLAFGAAFEPAVTPLRLIYPGILAMSGMKILSSYILSRGKPKLNAMTACIGLLFNIILNVSLIPRWGVSGAAVASSVSFLIMAALQTGWFLWTAKQPASTLIRMNKEDWHLYGNMFHLLKNRIAAWR